MKIIVTMIVLIVTPLSLIMMTTMILFSIKMAANLKYSCSNAIQTFDLMIDQSINRFENLQNMYLRNVQLGNDLEQGNIVDALYFISINKYLEDIKTYVFTVDGKPLVGSSDLDHEDLDVLSQQLFSTVLPSRPKSILLVSNQGLSLYGICPVNNDQGIIVGALGFVYRIDRAFMDQAKAIIKADVAIIIDKQVFAGDFLTQHMNDWLPPIKSQLIGKKGRVIRSTNPTITTDIGGIPYFLMCSPLTDLKKKSIANVVVGLSMKDYIETFFQTIIGLSIVTTISIFCAIWIGYAISGKITNPILKLAEKVRLVGKGEWVELPDIQTHDEIEVLSREFSRLQHDLRESIRKSMLNKNLATLGRFSADVIHEIKNPLEGLKLLVNGLQRKIVNDPQLAHYGCEIEIAIQKLESLIQESLDFARITKPEKEEIDLKTFLTQFITQSHLKDRVEVSLPEESCYISVDREHLKRILNNLLINACEAISGDERVRLSVIQEQSTVNMIVEDEGPGITDTNIDRIFEPFFSTKKNGHGLGLSIAYHLSQNNGLDLSYEKATPHGSRFIIKTGFCRMTDVTSILEKEGEE